RGPSLLARMLVLRTRTSEQKARSSEKKAPLPEKKARASALRARSVEQKARVPEQKARAPPASYGRVAHIPRRPGSAAPIGGAADREKPRSPDRSTPRSLHPARSPSTQRTACCISSVPVSRFSFVLIRAR